MHTQNNIILLIATYSFSNVLAKINFFLYKDDVAITRKYNNGSHSRSGICTNEDYHQYTEL